MNPNNLTEEQAQQFGQPISGSKYVRDFCVLCKEPIRVPSERLFSNNYCFDCDGHQRPAGTLTKLNHLQDYNGPNDIGDGSDRYE